MGVSSGNVLPFLDGVTSRPLETLLSIDYQERRIVPNLHRTTVNGSEQYSSKVFHQ